ncbi:MAG: AbrB/MazE/SpoVT family DNA-binding domain-containing protein [Nanoarchaeota archaeon]|nr:AbrB/MazE/SpoVT family DNA-binding domain-containing protein [Nanoarchaeota archaeon]
MARRKVSLIGPSTLMVSLPSKWVKEFGIKKGDEVDINVNGSSLLVETSKLKKNEVKKLDISNLSSNLIRYFIYSSYRNGNGEIELSFDDEHVIDCNTKKKELVLDVISSVVENLVGVEIMVQRERYVLIREISTVNRDEFANTLGRIFVTLVNSSNDIRSAMKNNNKELLDRIKKSSDKKINKLCDFCFRIINKGGIVENSKVPFYYSIISVLEELGDALEDICKIAIEGRVSDEEISKVNKTFEILYKLFCSYKKETLNDFYKQKNEIRDFKTHGDMGIAFSKIASCCSSIIPEMISLNL